MRKQAIFKIDIINALVIYFLTVGSLGVIFMQVATGISEEHSKLLDVLNLIINAATIGVITLAGRYAQRKVKEYLIIFTEVSQVMPKLEQISCKVEQVDHISQTVQKIEGKVETIERNTGNEIMEMKTRYAEVLDRLYLLEQKSK